MDNLKSTRIKLLIRLCEFKVLFGEPISGQGLVPLLKVVDSGCRDILAPFFYITASCKILDDIILNYYFNENNLFINEEPLKKFNNHELVLILKGLEVKNKVSVDKT